MHNYSFLPSFLNKWLYIKAIAVLLILLSGIIKQQKSAVLQLQKNICGRVVSSF